MPIFVDHAGMNTLLNQSVDTTSNTLDKGEVRLRSTVTLDRAIGTNDINNETDKYLYLEGLGPGQWPTSSAQGGFTFSFWVKFNEGAAINSQKMMIVGADSLNYATNAQAFYSILFKL